MGSIPVAGAKKQKYRRAMFLFFSSNAGIEGVAVMNDMTVACQNRGVNEPAGETDSRCGCQVRSLWIFNGFELFFLYSLFFRIPLK